MEIFLKNTKGTYFFFLLLFFQQITFAQLYTNKEFHSIMDMDSLSFRNQIEKKLEDNLSIDVEFIGTPSSKTDMYFLNLLIPVLEDFQNDIRFKFSFPFKMNQNGEPIFTKKDSKYNAYLFIAIRELYPDKYYEFLNHWTQDILTERNNLSLIFRQLMIDKMKVMFKIKELTAQNTLYFHQIVKKYHYSPIVKYNSKIIDLPSISLHELQYFKKETHKSDMGRFHKKDLKTHSSICQTLIQKSPLKIDIDRNSITKTCRQKPSASFRFSVSGGIPPYSLATLNGRIDHNVENQLFTNLSSGTFILEIVDYCNNSTSEQIKIERTDPIEYKVTVKNTCLDKKGNDLKTGNVSISGDYKLEIKNGINGQLGQGLHAIVVTDETGCFTEEVVTIGTSELTNCHPDPEND